MSDQGTPVSDTKQATGAEQAERAGEAFLEAERKTIDRLLPGLDERLASHPLEELESRESPAIEYFRESGASNILIPSEYDGVGATAVEALRVQRAIGSRAPSLAIAATMHSFSLAGLLALAAETEEKDSVEWMLLQGLAQNKLLVASGFAEGKSGQGLFAPTMRARRDGENWLLSGSKKPCSLAYSMDLMATSCAMEGDGGEFEGYAIAVVSSQLPGIEVEPFWSAPVLTGAQSECVTLRDVEIHDELMIRMGEDDGTGLDDLQTIGVVWFELLMTASYLGMASALVERVLKEGKSDANSKVQVAYEIEASMAALESVAHEIDGGRNVVELALRSVLVRYAAQDAIARAAASSVEQLGGMAFIGGPDVAYMASASRAICLHPPSRSKALPVMVSGLTGEGLELS